jgi:hypothetical protein
MTQSELVDESVAEWSRLLPGQNMLGLDVAQRLAWNGRLAHRIWIEAPSLQDWVGVATTRCWRYCTGTAGSAHSSRGCQEAPVFAVGRARPANSIDPRSSDPSAAPDTEDRRVVRLRVKDGGRRLIDEAFSSSLEVYESPFSTNCHPPKGEQLSTLLNLVPSAACRGATRRSQVVGLQPGFRSLARLPNSEASHRARPVSGGGPR